MRTPWRRGSPGSWANGARWKGLILACQDLGLRAHRARPCPPTVGGVRAVGTWERRPTTAVIGCNDILAVGFMKSAITRGIRVPEDLSVIGIDNAGLSALTEPGPTSLATRSRQLRAAAAGATVGHLRHRSRPLVTTLEMSVQVCASVGPVAARIPARRPSAPSRHTRRSPRQ